ncbi:hypothetical protein BMR1_03g02725 [Babesia microti strain RI]|uniref:Uncharacterized protein n=1 Tax=Babesia microti (strain RI) TaxID=1133968 RepID=A0A1R4AC25_BABMR|nr:hypothetical protein BMR1_03g02725 [Babesia microti strain RI]SJK86495.1 hypothetical protein BMR1_03g02725 [Babesia microti strain RI]|eukprot:XP_021338650.1 hypothetical protein BMR1_03g02725 [Babesia microti strain RI]
MLPILLLVLAPGYSLTADITTLCEDVREIFQIINGQLLTFTPPEHCSLTYGLGQSVLGGNAASTYGCFEPIYDKICSIRLVERVYGPTCQSALALFRRIVESDIIELGSSGEIVDSKNFCDKSFIMVKGGASDNVKDRPQRFQSEDLEDCRAIVESYNTCVSLTSAIAGANWNGKECLYKFKYCELAANWDSAAIDSGYCKNVIAPMLLMDALLINGYKRNTCSDLSNYETYLTQKKLELDKSAKECLDTANSMTIVSRWEDDELSNNSDIAKTQESVNEVFNKLHIFDSKGLGFDSAVISEFNKIVTILEKGERASMSFSHDFLRNIVIFSQIKHSLPMFSTHLAVIEELLSRGHVSFTNAFGFQQITADRIEDIRTRILKLFTKCHIYTEKDRLTDNNINASDDFGIVMELRNHASELKDISNQFNEQIRILKRWRQGETDKASTLPSALARLGNLAGI